MSHKQHVEWLASANADKQHLIRELEKIRDLFEADLANLAAARLAGMDLKQFRRQLQETRATHKRVLALLRTFKKKQS